MEEILLGYPFSMNRFKPAGQGADVADGSFTRASCVYEALRALRFLGK